MTFQQEIYNKRFEEKGCFLPLNEEWVKVDRSFDRYIISNYGRIKSLNYKNTGIESLLLTRQDKDGYRVLNLSINNTIKTKKIHRIMLESFLLEKEYKKEVNHIDEIKHNNFLWNIEFVTSKENANHGTAIARSLLGRSKPVVQKSLNGEIIKTWKSASSTESEGFNRSHVSACCRGCRITHHGYEWEFA